MKIGNLIQVLCAAHLSKYVESPFQSRGGILLVGPPACLKTSLLLALEDYPNALVLSDLTTKSLVRIRDDIVAGKVHTLALMDLQKIYERHDTVAANVEGNLRALVDEGFSRAAFEDQRMLKMTARCLVLSAMTPDFYSRSFTHWDNSGFTRRFLWCQYRLKNPAAILEAIHHWKRLEFQNGLRFSAPFNRSIPYSLTGAESRHIASFLKYQHGAELPFILLKKIACVLRWRHKQLKGRRAANIGMEVLEDFATCLGREGAEVEL